MKHLEILTAEELMRARYEAYTKGDIDFIISTHDPLTAEDLDEDETRKWALESQWLSLEILNTKDGKENDEEGVVEFVVKYIEKGIEKIHHERSLFIKRDGKWFYSGWLPLQGTIVKGKKVGANDPCPCGKLPIKKYKKCCGK